MSDNGVDGQPGEDLPGRAAYLSPWTLLSLATFLYWVATQSLRPFVPIHLADLGSSEAAVGLAVAAHPFLSLFLAIPAGRFIDLRGIRRIMIVSLIAMALVGGLYATLRLFWQLVMVQALDGLAELGAWVSMQALITRVPGEAMRRRHLGLFSVLWALGVAVGPTTGAWAYAGFGFVGVGLLYSTCAALGLAAVLGLPYSDGLRVIGPRPPAPAPGWRRGLGRVATVGRTPGVAITLGASFVMLFANSLRTSFYPLFLESRGVPVTTIGLLVSLAGVTLVLARLPLPLLLRRYRSVTVMLLGTAAAVAALVLTPALVSSEMALWTAAAVFGAGFGLNSPVTIDVLADATDGADRGLAMGMRVASNRLAQVSQPLVFGAVAGVLGMTAGFVAAGVIMGGTLGLAGLKARRRGF